MLTKNGLPEPRKNLQAFLRTRLCRYYVAGKCTLGDACKFAHSYSDMRDVPDFRKTRMCDLYFKGLCSLSEQECSFAHSRDALKVITDVYKTSICKHWEFGGSCRSGKQCRFAHGEHELRDRAESSCSDLTKVDTASHRTDEETVGYSCKHSVQPTVDSTESMPSALDLRELLAMEDEETGQLASLFDRPIDIPDAHTAAEAILAQLLLLHSGGAF